MRRRLGQCNDSYTQDEAFAHENRRVLPFLMRPFNTKPFLIETAAPSLFSKAIKHMLKPY